MSSDIEGAVINQLSDNYSYVIYTPKIKKAIIIDPAESKPIIDFLKKKYLSLQGILITHHHSDHTSGIRELISFKNVVVYSSNLAIPASGATEWDLVGSTITIASKGTKHIPFNNVYRFVALTASTSANAASGATAELYAL